MTEGEFLKRSGDLESALVSGNIVEFCDRKISESNDETETTLWSFLKVRIFFHRFITDLKYSFFV